jgi:uncharacterized protein YjiS (DUF1127 family)
MGNMNHKITSGLCTLFERVGRAHVRRSLLRYNDRALEDMGFSKELLEAGTRAWPWRAADEATIGDINFDNLKPYRNAVNHEQVANQLRNYSDTELADLGPCRTNPDHAIRDEHLDNVGRDRFAA